MMRQVRSKDGTTIAFESTGQGPAIILVGGALSDRSGAGPLASLLAPYFTVFAYDRRGRGDSGDTPPYAVQREFEDIDALIQVAGGSAFAFGGSSGAVLALEAAAAGLAITKLAMYEPPFIIDDTRPPLPQDYVARMQELVSAGRHGDAVEFFMTAGVGVPAEMVAQMRSAPMWSALEKMAHTLPYDGNIMGYNMAGNPLQTARWANVAIPALIMDGGESPEWLHHAARGVADLLPNAQYRTLEGQTHTINPPVIAPVLIEFFQLEAMPERIASRMAT
jgi:pimeloyl-ACP methyl ester carboxylesterase